MNLNKEHSGLCYDDILLVPADICNVDSRSDVSLKKKIGNPNNKEAWIEFKVPVVIAPMENISSKKILTEMIGFGGTGFIQRFQPMENRLQQLKELNYEVGFSLNIEESENQDLLDNLISNGCTLILLDTAFAHTSIVGNAVKSLRSRIPNNVHIMTGNVSSYESYKYIMDCGADSVRVGIGGGAACITRLVTGHGVPVLSSIMSIYEKVKDDEINGLIADGGIKETGDIVKALAAGASAVMMGTFFAGHDECDGNAGEFRGLASKELNNEVDPDNKYPHVEGVSGTVKLKGPILSTLLDIQNNIRSACSYSGILDINDLPKKTTYIVISALSMNESSSRI